MADSLTIKLPNGLADQAAVDPTNSATATTVGAKMGLIGPSLSRAPNTQGRYVREVAGASGTFRWIADEPITGSTPTTFVYVGLPT